MTGRGFAVTGFIVGISASVASNVLHSWLIAQGHTLPLIVASLGLAGFWPIALYLCLEVISRVAWPPGVWYWIARYLGLGSVALIAGYVSYEHMHGLLTSFGEERPITYAAPIAIDGIMILCSAALIAVGVNMRKPENRPEAVVLGALVSPLIIPPQDQLAPIGAPKEDRGGEALKTEAMQWVRDYTGPKTLTGPMVGTQFGRGRSWGQGILRAVKDTP